MVVYAVDGTLAPEAARGFESISGVSQEAARVVWKRKMLLVFRRH